MPRPGTNQDRLPHGDGNDLVVQLHTGVAVAFEEIVDLEVLLMEMFLGVDRDFGDVESSGEIGGVDEGSPCEPARTSGWGDLIESNDFVGGR